MIKRLLTLFVIALELVAAPHSVSQELNCKVEINADKVQNANKEIFNTLQSAISDYMNTQKWTDAQFGTNEKIECRLYFTINSYDEPNITGDLQIQSMRPVYNSSYTTTVINFKDTKVEFSYELNQPLVYNDVSWESNLTGILNFYAYLIIAMDFDTFSLMHIMIRRQMWCDWRKAKANRGGKHLRTPRIAALC